MRNEKRLLTVPILPCPKLKQKPDMKIDRYKKVRFLRFSAGIVTIKGEDVLMITTYDAKGAAEYRFFQAGDQYGMQVFRQEPYSYRRSREPGKMYRAAMDSVYPSLYKSWWYSDVTRMYSTAASNRAVYRFLGKTDKDGEAIELLVNKQSNIRQEKLEARDEKERLRLREAFAGVDKEIPQEFKDWAEEVPLRSCRYFFYDYTRQKEQPGICSHCKKRTTLAGIKERERGTCPNCGTEFSFYSAKRLNNSHGIAYRARAAFFYPVNDNRIAVRCCQVGISLRGGTLGTIEKTIWASEDLRLFLNGKGQEIERYSEPEGTTKVYVDGLCRSFSGWNIKDHMIAPMHLEEIRKRMKIYAPLEILAEHGLKTEPDRVLIAATKNPQIEYLIKLGLYGLANNEFKEHCGRHDVLLKGKTAIDVLGISPDFLPLVKEADPSARAFLAIRSLHKCGMKLTVRDMKDITALHIGSRYAELLFQMAGICSIHKALKYIARQAAMYRSNGEHVLQEWNDYLNMAKVLHMNLGDHCAVMPKSLKAAHDEAVKIQRIKKNEDIDKRMAKTAEKLRDLSWEFDGMIIRPAVSHEELFDEGQALSHCVGHACYSEKQASGKTAIFFIRRRNKPNESFVTLELDLKRWEKIQCYGKHDAYPGRRVMDFVKRWISEVVKPSRSDILPAARVQIAV